ncbi:MAG TPA: alkaline phosphatase family protein [Ignavibacteriaceae bacterium]|nr:alkaline phosphatase family protein [Ignavibacteriaceae bacterium]
MSKVLMVFLDGIGIGKKDYQFNPFFKYGFKAFKEIFGEIPSLENPRLMNDNIYLFPSDATLELPGLPQSGTGQTSLFCGFNAPKFVGKHFGPYPYSTTIPLLEEKNILVRYRRLKKKSFFANAYPEVFFNYINSGRSRLGVTAMTCMVSGINFNSIAEVKAGEALTAEMTNERWNKKLGYNLPVLNPESAAIRLLKIAASNDFTLYEYYLTDHIGHRRLGEEFEKIFDEVDRFLLTIITELDNTSMTLIICSDHGNLEDLSTKTHTLNPALMITAGLFSKEISASVKDITDVTPSIIKFCT